MGESGPDYALVRQQIAQAVATERERIAKLVSVALRERYDLPSVGAQMASLIRGSGE